MRLLVIRNSTYLLLTDKAQTPVLGIIVFARRVPSFDDIHPLEQIFYLFYQLIGEQFQCRHVEIISGNYKCHGRQC